MTPSLPLAKLIEGIDEADAYVELIRKKKAVAQKVVDDCAHEEELATAQADGMRHAYFLLEGKRVGEGDKPAPADNPKPEKRDTLSECIAAIRNTFMMPLNPEVSDRMAQEQLAKAGHRFRLPTVRNAIAAINKESRAAETSDRAKPEGETRSPQTEPLSSGAGNPSGGLEDLPGFLDQRKTKPAAAAE